MHHHTRFMRIIGSIPTALLLALAPDAAADQTAALVPVQDAFVREQDPTANFGAAGNLCVAGANSVNGQGQPRGRFDSDIKFDAAPAVAAFDAAFGAGRWSITGVELQVMELAAPQNPIFPRGLGDFRIAWLSDDSWTEGTGTPNAPTQGTGNEITWQLLQTMLTTAVETPLGTFSNTGITGFRQYTLALDPNLVSGLSSGGLVSLHLLPLTPDLGFSFISRNFGTPDDRPQLLVTAAATVPGDMNCDGALDMQDVAPFALCLLDPAAYIAAYPNCSIAGADMNHDGLVDGSDVQGLATALLSP